MKTLSQPCIENQDIKHGREVELLLCCARTCLSPSTVERTKVLLEQDIDWEYLLKTAYCHKVLPLLALNLMKYPQAVPVDTLERLRQYYYINAQHNLTLGSKLIQLLDIFEKNGISVIPFKGPVLAACIYGDIARREFGDLDFLVHREDFLKTKELLTARGYQPYASSNEKEASYLRSLTLQQQEAYLRSHWELHLVNQRDRVTIDVHQGILPKQFSFLYNTEWMWKDTQLISFTSRQILSFSPEDLILVLCSQGGKDSWQWLNRICDLAEVIRACRDVNWEKIWERASKLRMRRMLLLGLSLAHELLDAVLPEIMIEKIKADPSIKVFSLQVSLQLFNQAENSVTNYKFKNLFFHLKLIEHPIDKVGYCYEHMIVPTVADKAFLRLPKFFSFLYYLLRPIRLITMYLLSQLGNLLINFH
ncbi:hypothetical protein NUACC21_82120 [Scytonema sp. NUACC21]